MIGKDNKLGESPMIDREQLLYTVFLCFVLFVLYSLFYWIIAIPTSVAVVYNVIEFKEEYKIKLK